MSWKVWTDVTQLISWFNTDDVMQRLEILFLFTCLLGLTTNMIQSFAPDPAHNTYTMMVAFYLAATLFEACYCALTGALLPLVRGVMASHILVLILPSALWIASIHVSMPVRLALVFPALAMDLYGHGVVLFLFRYSWGHGDTRIGRRLAHWFDFFPAMNIEHRVERMNAFVALVFGYSVISVLFQNYAEFGLNAFLGKSILGLCQAFIFNWLYFDVDGANLHVHAIRRSTWSGKSHPSHLRQR
jgi:low temperature requirement protein LtrA